MARRRTAAEHVGMSVVAAKETLAPNVVLYEIEAPRIAKKHRAGQFVIVRPLDRSERIPLTIADSDPVRGTITLVVQSVGKTTEEMAARIEPGDRLASVAGPLGNATHIGIPGLPDLESGTVVCIAGGIGAAPVLPIAKAFHAAGHEVVTILGARNGALLILEERLQRVSSRLLIATDDGSRGRKGFVSDVLRSLLEVRRYEGRPTHLVVAIGPTPMMKACSETARPFDVPALVSLNTIMVDGTGMCGGCRVTVGGAVKYVCVDGPEFDGHAVDWGAMTRRQAMYRAEEQESLARHRHACELDTLEARAEECA